MNRRSFVKNTVIAGGALSLSTIRPAEAAFKKEELEFVSHSRALETRILLKELKSPISIMQITDTHISCDGPSDVDYNKYSNRMRNAYHTVKHYKTGETTTPLTIFDELLNIAVRNKVDLIALTGDIINYPSKTAVDVILAKMNEVKIPYIFTAGNHDWHYEGTEGPIDELREYWIENRLKPLYKGANPYYSVTTLGGIDVVIMDNSTYQISNEQLAFYKKQKSSNRPTILFLHIPLYMPSLDVTSTGHPDWGRATDYGFEAERRQPWPISGNSVATVNFLNEVMNSKNLIGVFTGHWHADHIISQGPVTQYVTLPGLNGQYRIIKLDHLT
jgi:predicted MPP superfamily phosphohydrolase